jgi:hypothetical protein
MPVVKEINILLVFAAFLMFVFLFRLNYVRNSVCSKHRATPGEKMK